MKTEILHIKGMTCTSCVHLIRLLLEAEGIIIKRLKIGDAEVAYDENKTSTQAISKLLTPYGFSLIKTLDELLIDKIKRTVIDLVYHMNNTNSIIQKSEYLVEMLDMNYDKIAREFRKHVPITLEQYIIQVKIERIKDLLEESSYTLSEMAYMMDYSSVQHLSAQFKKVTGMTVSDYKNDANCDRIPLDEIGGHMV